MDWLYFLARFFGQINLAEFQDPSRACAICAVAATGFTIAQTITLRRQGMRVWKEETDEGVSIPWVSFNVFSFANSIIYGVSMPEMSGILILNGLLSTLYIYTAIGLWRYGRVSWWCGLAVVVGIIISSTLIIRPEKDIIYIMSGVVSAFFLGDQPKRLFVERKRGVLEIKFVIVGFVSTIFWFVYGLTLPEKDIPIIAISGMIFTMLLITILLWLFWCNGDEEGA